MTPQDAASLLTALMIMKTSAPPMSTLARLTRSHLRELLSYNGRWKNDDVAPPPQLYRLKPNHTFGDAFSALLASIAEGDLENSIKEWSHYRPFGIGFFFELTVKIGSLLPFPKRA